MLRTIINIRDVAPDSELDEYESSVIQGWRSMAYGWLTFLTIGAGHFMVVIAAIQPADLSHWVYSGGLLTILGVMSSVSAPAIAYATTFGPVPPPNN